MSNGVVMNPDVAPAHTPLATCTATTVLSPGSTATPVSASIALDAAVPLSTAALNACVASSWSPRASCGLGAFSRTRAPPSSAGTVDQNMR